MSLSNDEKETIITFDETPADANVFTYNAKWKKHIEQRLGIKPYSNNGAGGRDYKVPKGLIRMPLTKRVYSPEQREKMAKRLAGRRPQKPPDGAGNARRRGAKQAKPSGEGKDMATPLRGAITMTKKELPLTEGEP